MTKHDFRSCDRCGSNKSVREFESKGTYANAYRPINFDLCLECIHKFSEWLEEGKAVVSEDDPKGYALPTKKSLRKKLGGIL